MSSRKILIAVIVVLFIVILAALYFLFFGSKGISTVNNQTGQAGTLPNTGTQTIPSASAGNSSSTTLAQSFGVVVNQPVLDYFVNSANTVTAVTPNGQVIQVANGQITIISTSTIQNILASSFSYDGEKVFVSYGTPANPQTNVFDLTKQTWTSLPAGLQSPTWSPSDYRIAYYTSGAQGTELFAMVDASKAQPSPVPLVTLHAQDLAIAWPAKNQVVIYTKPSAYVAGSAWSYNPQTAALSPVAIEIPGLNLLWGDNSALEFSSGPNGLGGSLALTDTSGNVLQQLKIATLPSKCLFTASLVNSTSASSTATAATASSTPYLYCGVPRDQSTFSISHLPDDYNQMALFTSDDIYQINLQTGAIATAYNDPSQNLDVSDMKFFNGTLFFINRYDEKLYGIQL